MWQKRISSPFGLSAETRPNTFVQVIDKQLVKCVNIKRQITAKTTRLITFKNIVSNGLVTFKDLFMFKPLLVFRGHCCCKRLDFTITTVNCFGWHLPQLILFSLQTREQHPTYDWPLTKVRMHWFEFQEVTFIWKLDTKMFSTHSQTNTRLV
jgi:hypothetical protein